MPPHSSPAPRGRRAARGFGLLDPLLACLVLGLGLLAWLQLPVASLRQLQAARQTQQAALCAANLAAWLHSPTGRALSCGLRQPTQLLPAAVAASAPAHSECHGGDCDALQVARLQLRDWARGGCALRAPARASLACRAALDRLPAGPAQPGAGCARVCVLRMQLPHRAGAGAAPTTLRWSLRP